MEKNIVMIENSDLLVGTFDLSKGFQIRHSVLKTLIENNKERFIGLGVLKKCDFYGNEENSDSDILHGGVISRGKKMGRKVEQYMINEEQYVFLSTLLPNIERAIDFKYKLTKEFFRMRKVLIKLTVQKQNEEWRLKRDSGKIERRLETDMIKEFVEYATKQGSKSASRYYGNISSMENRALLNIELLNQEFDNMRDHVEGLDLDLLKMADLIVAQALKEGMQREMWYKDIYILARDRVEAFAVLMGKSPLRLENKKVKAVA